jgi:hypothetical protein
VFVMLASKRVYITLHSVLISLICNSVEIVVVLLVVIVIPSLRANKSVLNLHREFDFFCSTTIYHICIQVLRFHKSVNL